MNENPNFDAEANPPEEAPLPPAVEFPWPPPENGSIIDSLATTWKESTFHPARFFAAMPDNIRLGPALLYYVGLSIIVAAIGLFWGQILPQPAVDPAAVTGPMAMMQRMSPLIGFLISPIFAVALLIVGAAITHAMLIMLTTSRGTYTRTACVYCFASGASLFAIVPYAGTFVGAIWSIVIAIIGLREAHRTTTGRAATAVLLPAFILGVLFMVIALIAVAGAVMITR